MTLTSSRISDEFKLIQEIMARAEVGKTFELYPQLTMKVIRDYETATLCRLTHRGQVLLLPLRHAVKYILRTYW